MEAYLIQEFSNLDQTWHSVNFASSSNGIYLDKEQAYQIYNLFKQANTNPKHLRLITCNLVITSAECGNNYVDFQRLANTRINNY